MNRNVEVVWLVLLPWLLFGCGSPAPAKSTTAAVDAPATSAPLPPSSKPIVRARKIETLADFEASAFCEQYHCAGADTYALRSGGNNTTYKTSLAETSVEVQTRGDRVSGFGLSFYERDRLPATDLAAIAELLSALDQDAKAAAARSHIARHIERKVFQINEAPSARFADYTVRAGKVGNDQVLSLDRLSK